MTPCFNEEKNVDALYMRVKDVMAKLPSYRYEHLFIDNSSKDNTVRILKGLAAKDSNVKIIVNVRNFGHIRSPYYGLLQSAGDVVIMLFADLQDPPELILDFIKHWEAGYKVVKGVKTQSKESPLMFLVRKMFYSFINRLSDIELTKNFTGFGLYDKRVIELLRQIDDPYPYFRGLISELGFEFAVVEYTQSARKRGITKNNFYTLYDIAMLGIISHSKIPLRLATMLGFGMAGLSLLLAFSYFLYKLIYWNQFTLGIGPAVIGLFFFTSIQLFFLGILGEYVCTIHTQTLKRPLVVEKERINF